MSLLQQLVADVSVEEPEYDRTEIVSWSIEDNKIKVNYNQSILLYDYYYEGDDNEVDLDAVDFTVNCDCIYVVESGDVTLGEIVRLEYSDMSFNQITEVDVETAESYDEQTLIKNLMLELTDTGPIPAIDIAIPTAVVKFVEL